MIKSILKYNKGDRVVVLSKERSLKNYSEEQVDNALGKSYMASILEIVEKLDHSYIASNGKKNFQIFESDIVSKTLNKAF